MVGKKDVSLQVMSFGLSAGIVWGFLVFVLALLAETSGYGLVFVQFLGTIYVGYHETILGAIIGGIWGFMSCFLIYSVFAWLYNLFAEHFHR